MKNQREPQWSIKELAEHTKVALSTLRERMRNYPIPASPKVEDKFDSRFAGRAGATNRYPRSHLLAWFEQQDQQSKFKRAGS
jgi:hypothetical protein|uniref:Pyocin activator protein PrtN n=1 Tax=Myoviridae sp. ctshb19 TaxID=2825194 RepID=A0A8S5UGI5_9CAUD|nr:MAG TPA: Pyocin activator protein PrtN [Myoviridae sp. ctshb19]